MSSDFEATIREDSERAAAWLKILGGTTVHIRSPFPVRVTVPERGDVTAYEMDLSMLAPDQRTRLIEHISTRFNVPLTDVERDLDKIGCPILADDVVVTVHNPQKWFMDDLEIDNDYGDLEDWGEDDDWEYDRYWDDYDDDWDII